MTRQSKFKEESGLIHLPIKPMLINLRLFNVMVSRMTPKRMREELPKLVEYLNIYISSFSGSMDTQFNDLDKILVLVKYYTAFIASMPDTDMDIMQPEEVTLVYIVHYLSSQTFDKKFSAITLLTTKVQRYAGESLIVKNQVRDILLRNGILKTLYITGYHPEIARKADSLFHFLAPVLKPETVATLLSLAFEQGTEKGANLCRCIRQSLGELNLEVPCCMTRYWTQSLTYSHSRSLFKRSTGKPSSLFRK